MRKGTPLSKEMFLNYLYNGLDEPIIKIIDVFICKLRRKIAGASNGKDYIETVRGCGYALRDPSLTSDISFTPEQVGLGTRRPAYISTRSLTPSWQ